MSKPQPVNIFISYAHEDEPLRKELEKHLSLLQRQGLVSTWQDRRITAGTDWAKTIDEHLKSASIILLLVSSDFLASDYCYGIEMNRALERHETDQARVIPILLRPVDWKGAPFAHLQALPTDAKAITTWSNQDEAFVDVVGGIRRVIEDLPFLSASASRALLFNLPTEAEQQNRSIGWGGAPDVPVFFGRIKELRLLEQWIVHDRCRLVALVGMGGVGKTGLSVKLARGIEEQFNYVIWRRLLNAPKLSELLIDLIKFLSNRQEVTLPDTVDGQISRLRHYLQKLRCLMILDNVEAILQGGIDMVQYSPGYEEYGQLFEEIADVPHQSCLLLTSREKPPEIARRESRIGPVHILELGGLNVADGKKIFAGIDSFSGSKEDWKQLNSFYNGNPLALDLAARHIRKVFSGRISAFLKEGKPIFANLKELLDWHFGRLSDFLKEVMYWFAINRGPTALSKLKEDILSLEGKEQISSTLQSLQERLPLETSDDGFTLQPVLMEYTTQLFIKKVVEEIVNGKIALFNTHALLKTSVSDYVRESQRRLILKPVSEMLLETHGNRGRLEARLKEILSLLRESPRFASGYAGGNLLNLLCYLKVDLRGYDFSSLAVWHAYLQGVNAQEVNFAHTNLARSVFSEAFGSVFSISFNQYGSIVAGTDSGDLWFWKADSGMPFLICHGHTDWVRSVAFHPSGTIVASGSDDQTIRLWDADTGNCLKILQGHTNWVRSVAFHPSGTIVASSSDDQTIRLWDTDTGNCLKTLQGHTHWVWSVSFSPNGKLVASGSHDKTVRIWDVNTDQCIMVLLGHNTWIWAISFSLDGTIIASCSDDQTIKLWDTRTGNCLKTFQGYSNKVWSVMFNPKGKTLSTASADQKIRFWDIETGGCLKTLSGHTRGVLYVNYSPDGTMVASSSEDRTVRLWEVSTGNCLKTLQGHTHWIWSVSFSPSGTMVASGSEDRTVKLWEVSTGNCLKTLQGHTDRVWSVSFSPSGTMVASGSDDRTVKLWEVSTGNCLKTLQGHTDRVMPVAYSLDGTMVASGSEDRTVKLWEVSTGNCLKTLQGHTDRVWSVSFSPSGTMVASGSDDGTVMLWDVKTGHSVRTLRGHAYWVINVAFSPDGRFLASCSHDGTTKLWDVQTGEYVRTLRSKKPYEGMNITKVTGLTEEQKTALKLLGAIED